MEYINKTQSRLREVNYSYLQVAIQISVEDSEINYVHWIKHTIGEQNLSLILGRTNFTMVG